MININCMNALNEAGTSKGKRKRKEKIFFDFN